MAERKGLSKGKRFEIFKRDGFTCQYCGKQPPDVILEIDHINPVSHGGDNDDMNLITACADCNRGKAAKVLGNVLPKPDADIEYLNLSQELAELRRYQSVKKERDKLYKEIINELQNTWANDFKSDRVPADHVLMTLLCRMSPETIEEAIHITSGYYHSGHIMGDKIEYFCGVAWKLSRGKNG